MNARGRGRQPSTFIHTIPALPHCSAGAFLASPSRHHGDLRFGYRREIKVNMGAWILWLRPKACIWIHHNRRLLYVTCMNASEEKRREEKDSVASNQSISQINPSDSPSSHIPHPTSPQQQQQKGIIRSRCLSRRLCLYLSTTTTDHQATLHTHTHKTKQNRITNPSPLPPPKPQKTNIRPHSTLLHVCTHMICKINSLTPTYL